MNQINDHLTIITPPKSERQRSILSEKLYQRYFKEAPADTTIWRYMSLSQFIDLLQRKAFYFPKASEFTDPHEGSVGKKVIDTWEENGITGTAKATLSNIRNQCKNYTRILCWHKAECESASLWEKYEAKGDTVAIVSSHEKVYQNIKHNNAGIASGSVHYIPDDEFWAPSDYPYTFMHKRQSFDSEKEFRYIGTDPVSPLIEVGIELKPLDPNNGKSLRAEKPPEFLNVKNLSDLIDSVYLSPNSKPYLKVVLEELLKTYKVQTEVKNSTINSEGHF